MSLAWLDLEGAQHELLLADPVVAELSWPTYLNREAALALASRFKIESITPGMEALASILVQRFVMPGDLLGDALHVAAATLLKCELLLTWNVKHLANESKQPHLRAVCLENGVTAPRLARPDILLQENEP